jgi:hypothetical protein
LQAANGPGHYRCGRWRQHGYINYNQETLAAFDIQWTLANFTLGERWVD